MSNNFFNLSALEKRLLVQILNTSLKLYHPITADSDSFMKNKNFLSRVEYLK